MAILSSRSKDPSDSGYVPSTVIDGHIEVLKALRDDTAVDDRQAVQELRVILRSTRHLPSDQNDFFTLLRFLKASGSNESKAAERWAGYMDWWQENDGNSLRDVSPSSNLCLSSMGR
jgi:hypothetical protein